MTKYTVSQAKTENCQFKKKKVLTSKHVAKWRLRPPLQATHGELERRTGAL